MTDAKPEYYGGFYAGQFTAEERRLIAAASKEPSLKPEIGLQRVVNHRLLAWVDRVDPSKLSLRALIRLARALERGNARLAQLLRVQKVLEARAAPETFVMEAFLVI